MDDAGGPVYYFETLPFLILLTAAGLQQLGTHVPARPVWRVAAAAAALLLMAGASYAFLRTQWPARLEKQSLKRSILDTFQRAPPGSLILVENLRNPHLGGMLLNPQGLASDPLLMRSPHSDWPVVHRVFPERKLFLYDGAKPGSLTPLIPPDRIVLTKPVHKFHRTTGRTTRAPDSRDRLQTASAKAGDRPGWLLFGNPFHLPRGRFRLDMVGQMDDVSEAQPLVCRVVQRGDASVLASTSCWGSANGLLLSFPLAISNQVSEIDVTVRFKGSGEVSLRHLQLTELDPLPDAAR